MVVIFAILIAAIAAAAIAALVADTARVGGGIGLFPPVDLTDRAYDA